MNYIGSKRSLIQFIEKAVEFLVGDNLTDMIFCDLFAGTGIVGRTFKSKVKKVISNDWEYFSYVLNRNYIGNHKDIKDKQKYIDRLNSLNGPLTNDGLIYRYYCLGSGSGRQYFSDENGLKIDRARQQVEDWFQKGIISENLYFFLLCSLIESADKLANTASVYGAFLKHLKASAKKPLFIEPALYSINDNEHEVFCEDANTLIKRVYGDILYLDPPYNTRQYGANYHVLNTIAEYHSFIPKGKTGLRDYQRSSFCSKGEVKSSFNDIIENAQFKYIILSYNNEGLMSLSDIENVMTKFGEYDVFSLEHQRFKADNDDRRRHSASRTTEYLHVLKKF